MDGLGLSIAPIHNLDPTQLNEARKKAADVVAISGALHVIFEHHTDETDHSGALSFLVEQLTDISTALLELLSS